MNFVDTNYFLRFIIDDDKYQYEEAKHLFLEASDGKVLLFTSVMVMFEIYWTLTKFYEKSKKEAINVLDSILDMSFLEIENKKIVRKAINLFKNSSLEFVDLYNLVFARQNKAENFKTFDKKLQKAFASI